MREVNVAWTALSDPTRRADYDRELRARATGPSGPGSAAYGSGASGPGSARSYGAPVDPADSIADDPDEFYRRLREAQLDPDEEPLSPWHFWILRRGPIVAAVVVALFLFVLTAYAGSGNESEDGVAGPTTEATKNCVRLTQGRTAVRVNCGADNDGHIVTEVGAALDCPSQTSYVLVDNRFICISSDPSVVGSPPESLGG
jgi:curved DNA-binding protein CbpA